MKRPDNITKLIKKKFMNIHRNLKKHAKFIFTLVMCASMFYATMINPSAETTIVNDGVQYTLDSPSSGQATVSGHTEDLGNTIVIPSTVEENNVSYTVTSIGSSAFDSCINLTNITLPNSITSIGQGAFQSSGLTSIDIPYSVISIESPAFVVCTNLTSINVDQNNNAYKSINGVLFSKDCTQLVSYPAGKNDQSYTIQSSVTSIGDYAFGYCPNLTNVTIPNSVTSIGLGAFVVCPNLTSATIPDSVTSIGSVAFYYCTGLTNVSISASVTSMGNAMFYNCTNLTNVTFRGTNANATIGEAAFNSCTKLEKIYVPNGFNFDSFQNSGLTPKDNNSKYDISEGYQNGVFLLYEEHNNNDNNDNDNDNNSSNNNSKDTINNNEEVPETNLNAVQSGDNTAAWITGLCVLVLVSGLILILIKRRKTHEKTK